MELQFENVIIDILPLGILMFIFHLFILRRRKRNLAYLICFSIFGVYLLGVAQKTLFPIPVTGAYADSMRINVNIWSRVNLIPLYFDNSLEAERILIPALQNILLTIPFGFGVNFIAKLDLKDFRWLILAGGFSLEASQLVISLIIGLPYRIIDINDVLLNSLGVWIGTLFFRLFASIYLPAAKHFDIGSSGLFGYIFEVARRSQKSKKTLK